jgi:putative nucleotidyltransferase with HDIG domain
MGLAPDLKQQELLKAALAARGRALSRAERRAELVVSGGFVLAAVLLLVLAPPRAVALDALPAVGCLIALVAASRIEFDVGSGWTTPTQLAFVPLLFTVPASIVPVAAVAALVAAKLPDLVRGTLRPSRLLRVPGNAWYSIGPAVVLAVTGPPSPGALPAVLALAVAAQLAGDVAAAFVSELLVRGATVRELLEEWWVSAIDLALTPVGLLVVLSLDETAWAALALLPLLGVLAVFARERRARVTSLVELNTAYRGTALVLGDVIEADDGYTGEHCRGVVALALQVGARLGLDAARLRNLEFAALLHDVGKVAIPKEIINKPGRLDPAEWQVVKTHTLEGQRMLDQVGGFMSDVGRIVRSHHERWDGAGYPDGLAGEAIPIEARIVSACDTWNAMTTTRAYRGALPEPVAVQELRACAGTQLDATVVAAVLDLVAPGEALAPAPEALAA